MKNTGIIDMAEINVITDSSGSESTELSIKSDPKKLVLNPKLLARVSSVLAAGYEKSPSAAAAWRRRHSLKADRHFLLIFDRFTFPRTKELQSNQVDIHKS